MNDNILQFPTLNNIKTDENNNAFIELTEEEVKHYQWLEERAKIRNEIQARKDRINNIIGNIILFPLFLFGACMTSFYWVPKLLINIIACQGNMREVFELNPDEKFTYDRIITGLFR